MSQNPCILAIDCATGPLSAAVWKDGRVAAYGEDTGAMTQSAKLIPMVEQVLRQASINYQDLTAVACTTGPGSFTSIRVGLASARAIAFAAGVPALGFTTLEVLASAARAHGTNHEPVLAALNAGKGEWYWQGFEADGTPLFEPQLGALVPAAAQMKLPALAAGNAGEWPKGLAPVPVTFPRADALAKLAAERKTAHELKPFYIRPPDAKPMAVDR